MRRLLAARDEEPRLSVHVAVAIVGFRNAGDIARCLEALGRSTHADFEVVVCENGGREAFDELVRALPEKLAGGQPVHAFGAERNLGFAGGVNRCLAALPAADAWWVLNPDTEPAPDALEIQLARLDKGDCDAVGCTLHLADGTVQSYGGHWQAWLARAISIGHGERQGTPVDARLIEARQNYLNGASMLIGRAFLERAGPMREDYFLYCEEVEWCLRARSCGLRLGFAPGAIVLHHQGSTTGNDREVGRKSRLPVRLNARNQILVTRDCFPARLPIVALAALGVILMRFGKRRAWRQLGFGLEGWAAGLADERGVPSWLTS